MSRLVAAPHPFKVDTEVRFVPEGLTLAEMLEQAQTDPVLRQHAHIWIGDQYIPRDRWHRVRPKEGAEITLRVVPTGGGGGGGGKNVLRIVLTIAVIAAAFAAPYLLPATGPLAAGATVFGGLTVGTLVTAAVGVAGMLLVNAIAPIRPPRLGDLSSAGGASERDSPTLFIEGARNTARPFSVVPVVLGTHRHVPPLGVQSYTEVIGDANYLRMLVVWGYGPLKIEDIKIGNTPITDFEGVTINTREGRAGDPSPSLIPDTVAQDDYAVLLQQAEDWQTRTTNPDADELSIDVTFPQGLVRFGGDGSRQERTVAIQIQYREVGGGSWLTPSFSAATVPDGWISGDTVTFTHNRTSAVRHGFRWSVTPRGTYEIRVRRTTADTDDTQIFDQVVLTAIRTITNESPLNFAHPLAYSELLILASDQLNRAVDELNATVSSYVASYGGSPAWVEAVSSNPADLFRHVLQGVANAAAVGDARVDVATLQDFYTFCVDNGFEFNMIRDFKSSVWETLADIASAGRASPAVVDGKWSVIYDYDQSTPVQHFTPRNSFGFEFEKAFPDQPHAYRIRFANRDKEWNQDERIVFADGYDENNAEDFATLDAIGITDPEHIWKFGRFHLAQAVQRPERYHFQTDFEYLVARRGDLVLVTHDVLSVGLKAGRIKAVHTGGSPEAVTGITVDETLTMEAGTDYGVSIRTVDDVAVTRQIVTNAGDQTTVTFSTTIPLANAPAVGDLFAFGELGSETIDALVLAIEPQSELTARVTCIPKGEGVYTADSGTIPAFDSKITLQSGIPNVEITNVRSDESVLQLGAGNTLVPHIAVSVRRPVDEPNLTLDVQIRDTSTSEPFYDAQVSAVQGSDYLLGGVEQGQRYDIRARWRDGVRLPGDWTTLIGHRVVGQSTAPNALQNATISVFGGQALIRWDRPAELDVRFGGEVRFRHCEEIDTSLATWPTSVSIGTAAKGDALIATLPLKPGTYLAKVFDKSGRHSDVVKLSTKQASVLTYANVATVTESPAFSGTHDNTVKNGSVLQLSGAGLFDDIPDLDAVADLNSYGGIETSGTYTFANGFDLTTVKRVRLTSNLVVAVINALDLIDERTANIDTWEDFDGTDNASADARVQVRHTDDDPNGSPVSWSAWEYLDSAEFEARGFQFRLLLSTVDSAFNIQVSSLSVVAEEI